MNNYHTHTYRCRHAHGNEKEIVERAIEEGYTELGFSDHVPLPNFRIHLLKAFPQSFNSIHSILSWLKSFLFNGPGMRMPYKEREKHQKIVRELKKDYQSQISILQGYECEYFKDYLPYYQRLLDLKEVDYLIFGHHFHRYSVSSAYYGKANISKKEITMYVDEAIEAMYTGLFLYFAHPDLFFIGYHQWDEFVEKEIYRLLKAAKKCDMLLEVNAGGYTRNKVKLEGKDVYPYPNEKFWKIASELECRVIIGLDVHELNELDKQRYIHLEQFCKKINIEPENMKGLKK